MERETVGPRDAAAVEVHRRPGGMSRGFMRDMVVSGVLPWLAVFVLQRYHVPIVTALALATIFPVADGIFSFVRDRRLDAIGIVNLSFLIGSIGITLWTGDVHVALLKGAVLTAAFSLLCLGSLFAPKPLMFFLGRQLSTRGDPVLVAEWNGRWQHARFRSILRLITAVWGIGYLLEVIARVIVAYSFPPIVVLATAPFLTYGVLALLTAWSVAYGASMRRKYAVYLTGGAATSTLQSPLLPNNR